MPQSPRKYQFTYQGNNYTFDWNKPNDPTDIDIEDVIKELKLMGGQRSVPSISSIEQPITELIIEPKQQTNWWDRLKSIPLPTGLPGPSMGLTSIKDILDVGQQPTLPDITLPYTRKSGQELSPEAIDRGSFDRYAREIAQEAYDKVIRPVSSPIGLGIGALATVNPAAAGLIGAGVMTPGAIESTKQAYEKPNYETVSNALLSNSGLALGALGAARGNPLPVQAPRINPRSYGDTNINLPNWIGDVESSSGIPKLNTSRPTSFESGVVGNKPSPVQPYNTGQFGLQPRDTLAVDPMFSALPNQVRPPQTNAVVFDALIPNSLKNRPKPLTPDEITIRELDAQLTAAKVPTSAKVNIITKAVKGKKIPKANPADDQSTAILKAVKPVLETEHPDIANALDIVSKEPPASVVQNLLNIWHHSFLGKAVDRFATSREKELELLGPAGKQLALMEAKRRTAIRSKAGNWDEELLNLTKGFTKSEIDNFHRASNGLESPINPKVANAITEYKKNIDISRVEDAKTLGLSMINAEGKKVPFQERPNYAPIRYPKGMWDDTATTKAAIMKEGLPEEAAGRIANSLKRHGNDYLEAIAEGGSKNFAIIDRAMQNLYDIRTRRYGEKLIGPQHARTREIEGYRTDLNVWMEHHYDWAKRLETARIYGPKDLAESKSPIRDLINQTTDPKRAFGIMEDLLQRGQGPRPEYVKFNNAVSGAMAWAHLPMFWISNINNQVPTIMRVGINNYVSALGKAAADWNTLSGDARAAGALYDVTSGVLGLSQGKFNPSKAYGITAGENLARTISYGAGKGYAQTIFRELKNNPTNKFWQSEARQVLLEADPTKLIQQDLLTPKQIEIAGARVSELSQGLPDPGKLPAEWSAQHPLVQALTTFQRYAFEQTKHTKDFLMSMPPAQRVITAGKLIILSQLFGELTGDVKQTISGTIRGAAEGDIGNAVEDKLKRRGEYFSRMPIETGVKSLAGIEEGSDWDSLVNRFTDNMLQSFALGIPADIILGISGDKNSFLAGLAPVALSDLANLIYGSVKSISDQDIKPISRAILNVNPITRPLAQAWMPTKYQEYKSVGGAKRSNRKFR